MTILSYIKGILVLIALFGAIFMGIGVWKAWSAYRLAKTAEKCPGTFKGYHTVYHAETMEDSDGFRHTARSSEALPMFTYTDAQGRLQNVTGDESHFFKHLKFGQKVVVLVPPGASGSPRLGDLISLYGNGFLNAMVAVGLFFLSNYGVKGATILLGPEGALHRIGQARLPVGDLGLMIGGFVVLAGAFMVLGYRYTVKRQDPALIHALAAGDYHEALALAAQGRGIDAKTPAGETTVIAALKSGQPQVASAILRCLWVNGNVYTAQHISAAQLAAQQKNPQTLSLLFQKGASAYDIRPSVIHDLIVLGETATLRLILENGYDLHQTYNRQTFGDLALMQGKTDIVRLIHNRQGAFRAPAAFTALALGDPDALAAALAKPGALNKQFRNLTLEQYAEKIGRAEMLRQARRP